MNKIEHKKLKILLHQLVVIRDKKCAKCDSTKILQASHIYPKGAYPHLRWNPRNVLALCFSCHFHWWHKNPIEAGEWYKKKFPKNYRYLKRKALENTGKRKHLNFEYNKQILERTIKNAR